MFSFAKKLKDKLEGGVTGKVETDAYFQSALTINNGGFGLRVLYVTPYSQAHNLKLEAWFDFIICVNGHDLPMKHLRRGSSLAPYIVSEDGSVRYSSGHSHPGQNPGYDAEGDPSIIDYDLLAQELALVALGPDKRIVFRVWSAKGGTIRDVPVDLQPPKHKILNMEFAEAPGPWRLYQNVFLEVGLTVSSQRLQNATHIWRILKTHAHSPAFRAQLVPFSDYIIGCDSAFASDTNPRGLLAGGGETLLPRTFASYYAGHLKMSPNDAVPIVLHVYNHDFDVVRPVTVQLLRGWCPESNRGLLGCDVGYGFLHRLPAVSRKLEPAFPPKPEFAGSNVLSDLPLVSSPAVFSQNIAQKMDPKIITKLPLKGKPSNRYAPVSGSENASVDSLPRLVDSGTRKPKENSDFWRIDLSISSQLGNEKEEERGNVYYGSGKDNVDVCMEKANAECFPKEIEGFMGDGGHTNDICKMPLDMEVPDFLDPARIQDPSVDSESMQLPEIKGLALEKVAMTEMTKEEVLVNARSLYEGMCGTSEVAGSENLEEGGPGKLPISATTVECVLTPEKPLLVSEKEALVLPSIESTNRAVSAMPASDESESKTETNEPLPQGLIEIDSLLDEDETFPDHNEGKTTSCETQFQPPASGPADACVAPNRASPNPPVPRSDVAADNLFSPMKPATALNTLLVPPIPRTSRRKKSYEPANLGTLTDFMNEELSNSKAKDTMHSLPMVESEPNMDLPPPPKSTKH